MGSAKRVLVVDDDADIVSSTVELFRTLGYEVKGCHNGHEAIQSVHDYRPDAVIMDIAMPELSGWDAARTIREKYPGKPPLLIAVTGERTGPADLIVSKLSGFDHYLLKPAEPAQLVALIEAASR